MLRTMRGVGLGRARVVNARFMEDKQNPFDQIGNEIAECSRTFPIRGK